jgi:cytochrome P450
MRAILRIPPSFDRIAGKAIWPSDCPASPIFPFGGGPRVCIGNHFAMMEAMLILVTIVQRFRLAWQCGQPVQPFASLTLRPKHGVWVTPTARTVASNTCR